jgi:hypothetical protein
MVHEEHEEHEENERWKMKDKNVEKSTLEQMPSFFASFIPYFWQLSPLLAFLPSLFSSLFSFSLLL